MKNPTAMKNILSATFFLLSLLFGNMSLAQGVQLTPSDYPYLYLSSAYVSSNSFSHGTHDPFYSGSKSNYSDKTVRVDLGLQVNKSIAFEAGYIRTPLWIIKKLTIDGQPISGAGGSSRARISFYSLKLKNTQSLWKNRLLFKSGLGYALGVSGVELSTLGPSEPQTSMSYGNTIVSSSTVIGLHTGNSHFITFDLGIEVALHKKISLFANATMYRGFTDLQQQVIDYNINGTEGSFTTTTDGSFVGTELGLRFNFR